MNLKYTFPYIIIIGLLCYIFMQRGCEKTTSDPVNVIVKEKKGSFPEIKNPVPIKKGVHTTNGSVHTGNKVPVTELPCVVYNEVSKKTDTIKENEYELIQEDSLIKTTNKIKTLGTLLSFQQDYLIKSTAVKAKPKETVLRVMAGMEIGNNIKLNDFAAKANLMFQNRKGDVISASFDTEQRIWVGYQFSILNIKGK